MEKAVIIVPSQGHDTNSFLDVAKSLKAHVYHHAMIVKTTVVKTTDASGGTSSMVKFTKLDGTEFSWDPKLHLARVLTVSHSFSGAGQNLAYEAGGDIDPPDCDSTNTCLNQPWGTHANDGSLSAEGQQFWQSVGHAMQPHGKIIMLGCFMGGGEYGNSVAKATGKRVFASTDLFGAGDSTTVLKHVRAIEKGHVLKPLKSFDP